jgi:hypothetical protein
MAQEDFVIAGTGTGCAECNGLSQCASCNPSELPALVPCSTGTVCLETVYTNCVVYNGAPITCGSQTLVNTGLGLTPLIQNLYAQICAGGFVGSPGAPGDPGPAPLITVSQTVQIATPSLPPIVISTETAPGEYNLQFRLPAGNDGVSPNVTPYNVTTGAPGTSALVTLDPSSTPSVKRFNFTIPRGDTGLQGNQGVGITSGVINGAGHLIITKSDASVFDAGYVVGPAGDAGANGAQGSPGSNSLIYKVGADAAGNVAVNALLSTSITTITVSNTSRVGYNGIPNSVLNNANAWLESVKIGDRLQMYKSLDSSTFGVYEVLTITSNVGNTSHIFTVNLVGGSGTFVMANDVSVSFTLKGNKGDAGNNGTDGAKGAVGPNTLVYECNSSTVTAPGKAVLNNGNLALVNTLILNETSMLGYTGAVASIGNASTWLNSIDTSARVQITDVNNSDVFAIFRVISSTHVADYHTFNLAIIASSGSLSITDQNFAINYVNPGLDGNYIVTNYIAPDSDPACPYGGILVETRSGVDDELVDPPLKLCNPKNGDYVTVSPAPTGDGAPCQFGGLAIRTFDGGNDELLSVNYVCNGPSYVDIVGNCEFNTSTEVSSAGITVEITNNDSGWLDLLGFDHLGPSDNNQPQVRRIGKQIFFRGAITIPMADPTNGGTTAITTGAGSYVGASVADIAVTTPFTGTGGVQINPNGGLYFKNNTTCLPTTLWCDGVQPSFNRTAFGGVIIAQRQTRLNSLSGGAVINPTTKLISGSVSYGAALSTVFSLYIMTNGAMYLGTVQDVEQPLGTSSALDGGSTMRPIICNVRTNDFATKWNAATTSFDGAGTGIVNSPLDADTSALGKWLVTSDGGNPNQVGGFSFTIDSLHFILD